MRAARFIMSGVLVRQMLHMPENAHFLSISLPQPDTLELTVYSPDLPDVVEGGMPYEIAPTFVTRDDGSVEWKWNAPDTGGGDSA